MIAAGLSASIDPERLLWVPGAKRIFIPPQRKFTCITRYATEYMDERGIYSETEPAIVRNIRYVCFIRSSHPINAPLPEGWHLTPILKTGGEFISSSDPNQETSLWANDENNSQ